ncbi:hypothetical protein PFLUV_G00259790 [Perca fluviatilis]|uniref:TBC1 domain-containing protein n=1 Tax=Perca fluviatilis TaxID=8168 RepID=A0A6A5EBI8_PERFL|nr:uncharacterized protein LOC120552621 [Perca fluviatilis]KAF1373363.1 hypothetical protein PFLUV_G00259790 [Perca fluviatilis]
MSCSCCCCVTPSGELLDGIRKKEQTMTDMSALRERYRSSTETQRRHTHVLLLRTVSEELSEAISIVPVTQALRSPWEPDGRSPPVTFDPDRPGGDPWHLHLDLHRRSRPRDSSPETRHTNSSSRRSSSSSSSSSESDCRNLSGDSTSDWPSSAGADRSTGDPETGHNHNHNHVSHGNRESDPEKKKKDPVSGSLDDPDGFHGDPRDQSAAGSEESFTAGRQDGESAASGASAWTGFRKLSAPVLRFTRQQSVGGVGSTTGGHQNQNYQPFPNRKTPRISEAARRLGMYSSF